MGKIVYPELTPQPFMPNLPTLPSVGYPLKEKLEVEMIKGKQQEKTATEATALTKLLDDFANKLPSTIRVSSGSQPERDFVVGKAFKERVNTYETALMSIVKDNTMNEQTKQVAIRGLSSKISNDLSTGPMKSMLDWADKYKEYLKSAEGENLGFTESGIHSHFLGTNLDLYNQSLDPKWAKSVSQHGMPSAFTGYSKPTKAPNSLDLYKDLKALLGANSIESTLIDKMFLDPNTGQFVLPKHKYKGVSTERIQKALEDLRTSGNKSYIELIRHFAQQGQDVERERLLGEVDSSGKPYDYKDVNTIDLKSLVNREVKFEDAAKSTIYTHEEGMDYEFIKKAGDGDGPGKNGGFSMPTVRGPSGDMKDILYGASTFNDLFSMAYGDTADPTSEATKTARMTIKFVPTAIISAIDKYVDVHRVSKKSIAAGGLWKSSVGETIIEQFDNVFKQIQGTRPPNISGMEHESELLMKAISDYDAARKSNNYENMYKAGKEMIAYVTAFGKDNHTFKDGAVDKILDAHKKFDLTWWDNSKSIVDNMAGVYTNPTITIPSQAFSKLNDDDTSTLGRLTETLIGYAKAGNPEYKNVKIESKDVISVTYDQRLGVYWLEVPSAKTSGESVKLKVNEKVNTELGLAFYQVLRDFDNDKTISGGYAKSKNAYIMNSKDIDMVSFLHGMEGAHVGFSASVSPKTIVKNPVRYEDNLNNPADVKAASQELERASSKNAPKNIVVKKVGPKTYDVLLNGVPIFKGVDDVYLAIESITLETPVRD